MLSSLLLCALSQGLPTPSAPALQGRVFLMRSPSSPARSGYFPDLRTALTFADDGDTLILEPGLYTGSGNVGLAVTKDVAIRGRYGADSAVIDCEGMGRALDFQGSKALVEGLTIRGGQAEDGGGARVSSGRVELRDVSFEHNAAEFGGGLMSYFSSTLILSRCRFLENSAASTGGGIMVGGPATLSSCQIEGNEARIGGGLFVGADLLSPILVSDTRFERNSANDTGGGIALVFGGSLSMDRCAIVGNEAGSGGAMVLSTLFEIAYVTNSLIVGNTAQNGPGGISAGRTGITNCTVVGNRSLSSGAAGIQAGSASKPAAIVNCIIRDNVSNAGTVLGQQIEPGGSIFIPPDLTLLYSNVEGLSGSPTNIDLEPQFVDPANGDYHLLPSSLCVDAGLGFSLTLQQRDIDGEPRFQGLSVDIGCDEVPVASLGGS